MIRRFGIPILVFGMFLCAGPAFGYGHYNNVDVHNIGVEAFDVAVVLVDAAQPGTAIPQVYWHYQGKFRQWQKAVLPGNKVLMHWSCYDPNDDEVCDPIPNCTTVHIGWETKNPHVVDDAYWTDAGGNRIDGSEIVIIKPRPRRVDNNVIVDWHNAYVGLADAGSEWTIRIDNVQYAVFDDPFPLDDLCEDNEDIVAELQDLPLPGGATYLDIPYGGTGSREAVPGVSYEELDPAVILRYTVSAPDDVAPDAEVSEWAQFTINAALIPTLTEWGAMVMTLLVLAAGTIIFRKLHRPVAA